MKKTTRNKIWREQVQFGDYRKHRTKDRIPLTNNSYISSKYLVKTVRIETRHSGMTFWREEKTDENFWRGKLRWLCPQPILQS